MANIRVLAIDQTLGEKDGQKVVIGKTATLELTPRQAEQLALSRQLGTLSLSLRSLADAGETALPNDDDRASGKRAGINTVRFGVSTVTTPK
jgi:pilus assembly protein CpaB